jgi:hypothetical protein
VQPLVVAPAVPSVAKPPNPNAAMTPPVAAQPMVAAPMPQMRLAPPTQGNGMARLNSAAVCGMNTTPRITNINGTISAIVFKPGDPLNIAGCGFGNGGQAYLSSGGTTVPLKIDTWSNENIHAHLILTLSGIPDLGSVKVNIQPNGSTVIGSAQINSFLARRETLIMTTNIPHYIKFEGGPSWTKDALMGQGLQQNGVVSRSISGIIVYANADPDLFTPLDLGNGFKVTNLRVQWFTQHRSNGETNFNSGHLLAFRGENKFEFNVSGPSKGKYSVYAGEQIIQDRKDPQLPPLCIQGGFPIGYCHYSKYQVFVEVTGPAGVTPP